MKNHRLLKMTLPFVMAVSLVLSGVAEASAELPENSGSAGPSARIVREDASKRGEFEKHFVCEDGSYIAAGYPFPVHELSESGEWMEIDNTLSL